MPPCPADFSNVTPKLTYSYETCGFVNTFSSGSALDKLRTFIASNGGKVRVSFPGESSDGFNVVNAVDGGVGNSNKSGSAIVLMDRIFAEYGFQWKYVPVSARSHEYSPLSSYTACVHEVALGTTDMCWGNFWSTSARLHIASFTASFFSDQFVVVTWKEPGVVSFGDTLLQPFKPFTPLLWILFVLSLAYTGLMVHYEANPNEKPTRLQFFLSSPVSVLKGLHAFNVGEIASDIGTSGSWLTNVVLGFTVICMVTGYTAVVTTQLIQQEGSAIKSLEEGIRRGRRFCIHTVVKEALESTYSGLKPLTVELEQGVGSLEAMDAGLCNIVIMPSIVWDHEISKNESHCRSKIRLQQTVASVPNSYPVRPELERVLSWKITKHVESGYYAQLESEAKRNYTRLDAVCRSPAGEQEVSQFGVRELGGPIYLLLLVTTISAAVTWLGNQCHRISMPKAQAIARVEMKRIAATISNGRLTSR